MSFFLGVTVNQGRGLIPKLAFLNLFLFFFPAFCRQDEIESKLLKIEGLITSIGRNIYTGESVPDTGLTLSQTDFGFLKELLVTVQFVFIPLRWH